MQKCCRRNLNLVIFRPCSTVSILLSIISYLVTILKALIFPSRISHTTKFKSMSWDFRLTCLIRKLEKIHELRGDAMQTQIADESYLKFQITLLLLHFYFSISISYLFFILRLILYFSITFQKYFIYNFFFLFSLIFLIFPTFDFLFLLHVF